MEIETSHSPSAKVYVNEFEGLQDTVRNITIIAEEQLLGNIQDELAVFESDLENEGYQISIIAVTNQTSPCEIKYILRVQFSLGRIIGAFLVGNIKAAYSENHSYLDANTTQISLDPIDAYYMDLDGHWENVTHPDFSAHKPENVTAVLEPSCTTFYDEYIVYPNETLKWNYMAIENPNQYSAEIWVSRIMGHNLDVEGKNESQIIKDFFNWDHDYRTGKHELIANQAYFLDAVGAGTFDFDEMFSPIISEPHVNKSLYQTCLSDPKGSELLYFHGHSNSKAQAFSDGILPANELVQMKKKAVLYILETCYACRWDNYVWSADDPNYPGGVYVFSKIGYNDDFGLCAIGLASAEYGIYGFDLFVKHLNEESQSTYGEAYLSWLRNFYENWLGGFELLFSVFLGDPTIGPPRFSVCNVDTRLKYPTIQSAIDSPYTKDGHTIRINGVFCEGFTVHKSLTLEGSSNATAIIDGYNTAGPLVQVYADRVNITGFTLRNAEYGLRLTSCIDCYIAENVIANCSYGLYIDQSFDIKATLMAANACRIGIYSYFSDNCFIEDSTIVNSAFAGVELQYSDNCLVSENNLTNNGIGLLVENSECVLLRNRLSDNREGIFISSSADCVIEENTLDNGRCAVGVRFSNSIMVMYNYIKKFDYAVYLAESSHCTVFGNKVSIASNGIYLIYKCDYCKVEQNLIYSVDCGIFLSYLKENIIACNTVTNSNLVMYLDRCNDTRIFRNCFINSSSPTIYSSLGNVWDNGYDGNYWSDYNSSDLDRDGICDAPYFIDANNQDNYPLMSPYLYADVNHDAVVNMTDIDLSTGAFGSYPTHPKWNPHYDINEDDRINMRDLGIVCSNFMKTWSVDLNSLSTHCYA